MPLTPRPAVSLLPDVPAAAQDESEDVIARCGRLFAAIRRNEWTYPLALADAFLGLVALRGEDDYSGVGRAEAARLCSMSEIHFHEPGAGAWIEHDEKLDSPLKPDFGVWVHSNGALLGTSVVEAF